ncbi:hypothetical protein APF79_04150 [bacterium BRH_c32]|nr:MAG: hypothetical protein APF79_04150 [bacterium BRH_c32]
MNYKNLFITIRTQLMIGIILLALNSAYFSKGYEPKRPNIVIVLTDDQGWGDLACNGNKYLNTPALDELSHSGVKFNNFYVSPLCAPSRASLLTGRYHLRTGVSGVTNREEIMRLDETTFAQVFQNAGYATGCFGKWHNGDQYPYTPNARGFDEFFGFCAGHWNNYFDTELQHNGSTVKTKGYITDVLTDAAIDFINKNSENPFVCYIPFNAPHSPFQVPDKYFDKYKKMGLSDTLACVYGMVENIDDNTKRILNTIDELGLTDNTIFIFMTDNGPNTWRYNGGMKGIKSFVDDGGVRVPCFIKYPNAIKPNTVIKSLAAHIDIFPTIAELCNIEIPDSLSFDGVSLAGLLTGKKKDDNNENNDKSSRLIFAQNKLKDPPISVRDDKYILVQDKKNNSLLYDFKNDPLQKNNIADKKPIETKNYSEKINSWYKEVAKNGFDTQPILLGYDYNYPIELQAVDAVKTDSLRFFEGHGWAHDWITNWKSPNDEISWNVSVIKESKYKVKFKYFCPSGFTGSELKLMTAGISIAAKVNIPVEFIPIPSPDRVKRQEAYECRWGILEIGEITLPKGSNKIFLKATFIPNNYVADFKSIILEKIN